ncbi:MAG: InlB B-repeat-containing protein [Clostridia bacterium]|nr:InlB B-repeat-containing protein [Clostridia bacterium]
MNDYSGAYSSWLDDGYYINISQSRTLNVSYNANGGSGAPSATYFYGSTESITLSSTRPTRTGYTFLGWATSSTATTATYSPGQNIGTRSSNLALYAVWQINSYNVSLTAGDHIASVSGGGSKEYNSSVTVEAVLASATGYTYAFDGWYEGDTKVSSDLSYTFTMPASAVALTAVGTRAANPYTVEFNANGGEGTMQPQDFVYDVSQDLSPNAFTRTGYTFLGWSTDPNAVTPTYTDEQNVSNLAPSGTTTLYAIWRLNTYLLSITATRSTVVVNRTSSPLGGGTIGALGNGETLYYNDSLTITFTANTGYTMTVQTVNGEDFASGSPHTVTAAVTVVSTAVANTYSVVFNANRGTGIGTGTMANQSFTYDQAQALTANAYTRQIPVTFNYTGGVGTPASSPAVSVFNGWARSADGAAVFTDGQSVSNLTASQNGTVTLFAKWANGNVTLPTPTRTGYTFKGWYSASTGGTKIGNGGDTYSPTAPVTIFAQWTIIEYTLDLTASDNGLVVNVLRSASPIGGGSSGLLSNGATLYYNDVITITYAVSQGYQLETATVNGEDISVEGRKAVTVTGNLVVVITVDLGAIVYIGNEAYQAFIGDGTNYAQYEAFFGNGSDYDPY